MLFRSVAESALGDIRGVTLDRTYLVTLSEKVTKVLASEYSTRQYELVQIKPAPPELDIAQDHLL